MSKRPACRWCAKELRPDYERDWVREPFPGGGGFRVRPVKTDRILGYGYAREGLFCTLRCGYAFGCWATKLNLAEAVDPHMEHCHSLETGHPEDCNCRCVSPAKLLNKETKPPLGLEFCHHCAGKGYAPWGEQCASCGGSGRREDMCPQPVASGDG